MKKNLLLLFILGLSFRLAAQNTAIFQTKEGAINGYDAVAYFKNNQPIKGLTKFSYEWGGAQWHFSSRENLKLFKASPEKYAPQYGGYCAYGYAMGHAAPTDPASFEVLNDKLYFNYNHQVQQLWIKDKAGYILKANKNYQEDLNKKKKIQ